MKKKIMERFISYVTVDTQSNEEVSSCPSTEGQLILAKQLVAELQAIGMAEIDRKSTRLNSSHWE